jgi:UDP-N-acetylglucosamine 2-epimerase
MILTAPIVEDNFMVKGVYESYIKQYVNDISAIQDIDVVISLHPREKNVGFYRSISKRYSNVSVASTISLDQFYELLNGVDLLFYLGASFSAVEAIFFDKPVVSVNLYGATSPYIDYFKDSMAVVKLDKNEDVSKTINRVLKDEEFQKELAKRRNEYIDKYYYKIDGNATDRIVGEIYSFFNLR